MLKSTMKITKLTEIEVPNLGQRIREARMSDPRSLKEICSLVGMTPQNWYRMESEKQSLSIEKLRTIEKILNIDLGVKFDD
jgi:transcriptional regulator with XRE-family HTH domain